MLLNSIGIKDLAPDQTDFEEGQWRIYGNWSRRFNTTNEPASDDSPVVPGQADGYNCGVFALTHAFNLAFGFDLQCFDTWVPKDKRLGPPDLNTGKKPRMAAELNKEAFRDEYAYGEGLSFFIPGF